MAEPLRYFLVRGDFTEALVRASSEARAMELAKESGWPGLRSPIGAEETELPEGEAVIHAYGE